MASSVISTPCRHGPVGGDRSSTAATVCGFISDGVPPPRKMLVTSRGPVRWRIVASSRREGAGKALLVHRLVADMAVEVAIGALGRAERPMDVDAEARFACSVNIRVLQRRAEHGAGKFLEGAGAVRQRLVLARLPAVLFLGGHLAEGLVMAFRQEDRIVAEALLAARRPDQLALGLAAEIFGVAVRPGQADDGDEAAAALLGRRPRLPRSWRSSVRCMAMAKSRLPSGVSAQLAV